MSKPFALFLAWTVLLTANHAMAWGGAGRQVIGETAKGFGWVAQSRPCGPLA